MFKTAIAFYFILLFLTNAERIEEKQLLPREPKSGIFSLIEKV